MLYVLFPVIIVLNGARPKLLRKQAAPHSAKIGKDRGFTNGTNIKVYQFTGRAGYERGVDKMPDVDNYSNFEIYAHIY